MSPAEAAQGNRLFSTRPSSDGPVIFDTVDMHPALHMQEKPLQCLSTICLLLKLKKENFTNSWIYSNTCMLFISKYKIYLEMSSDFYLLIETAW